MATITPKYITLPASVTLLEGDEKRHKTAPAGDDFIPIERQYIGDAVHEYPRYDFRRKEECVPAELPPGYAWHNPEGLQKIPAGYRLLTTDEVDGRYRDRPDCFVFVSCDGTFANPVSASLSNCTYIISDQVPIPAPAGEEYHNPEGTQLIHGMRYLLKSELNQRRFLNNCHYLSHSGILTDDASGMFDDSTYFVPLSTPFPTPPEYIPLDEDDFDLSRPIWVMSNNGTAKQLVTVITAGGVYTPYGEYSYELLANCYKVWNGEEWAPCKKLKS